MIKHKTIACDRCGARIDHIPEKCPECGEIIYDRMDPHVRERIIYEMEKAPIRKRKRAVLIGMLIWAVLIGVSILLPEGSTANRSLGFLLDIAFLFMVLMWCHYDSIEYGYDLSMGMKIFIVLLMPIAFPLCIFRSRGIAGFKTLAMALLFNIGLLVTAIVAALASYGLMHIAGLMS